MQEIAVGGAFAAVLIPALLYLWRVKNESAAGWWSLGALALIVDALLSLPHMYGGARWIVGEVIGLGVTTCFFAGALRLVKQPIPRWLPLALGSAAIARVVVWGMGFPFASSTLVWLYDLPLCLASAGVVARSARRRWIGMAERSLPWGFLALALLLVIEPWVDQRGPGSELALRFWLVASGALALQMVLTIADRGRERAAQLEEQLNQIQRLESLGSLAGGIAHDFNNQLTVILGNVEHLAGDPAIPEDRRLILDGVRISAEHCSALTQRLLTFARETPGTPVAVELAKAFGDLERLLRPLLPSGVELRVQSGEKVAPVLVDPTQLQQILLNLTVNARDAVGGHGWIELGARDVPGSHREGIPGSDRAARFVEIVVRDSGPGIAAPARGRIFEPFFSTKSAPEGTGLGLAIVHSIVEAHGGWIEFESRERSGTEFRVFLPAASLPARGKEAEPPPPAV